MMLLLSSGQLAQRIGEDRDRVSYVLRKTAVRPVAVAGTTRLFDEGAIVVVQKYLAGMRRRTKSTNDSSGRQQ